ncbi:MAG: glycosyltransferase, partial [Candidatus Glassbacteria bacterium]|nr:glycosyltransferase [Candidatus Glassbacteria bacterium]
MAPLGLLLAGLKRAPLVMMLHDYEPLRSLELRGIAGSRLSAWMISLFTGLYERADKIVVTIGTDLEALLARGAPGEKLEVLTHGIDVDCFLQQALKPCPFSLPKRPGRCSALYLGTMGVAHDVEKLIECFGRPQIRGMPVDLTVVGDGECAPACYRAVREEKMDNVRIFPPVDLDWVPGLLLQADVLVCSQKPDLFSVGSKFYEYLAAGKPLLVNSTGILARTVHEIGNGWVFRADDPDSLQRALSELTACP